MNNAAIGQGAGPWEKVEQWRRLMDVNFFGVLYGLEAFVPRMLAHGRPAAIVNVGSKQGITTPPGNAAYNVSKAGVKVLSEQLAHELRQVGGDRMSAHLLIPGFTFTAMTAGGRSQTTKPAGAWTPEQVIDVLMAGLASRDFYLLCPDNDVTRAVDEKRIRWASDDIIRQIAPRSRAGTPDYAGGVSSLHGRRAARASLTADSARQKSTNPKRCLCPRSHYPSL